MVDTHAHIGACEGDPGDLVARAAAAGVTRILTIGMDEPSNAEALAISRAHGAVAASVGRHPHLADGFDAEAERRLRELAGDDAVAAIGETGLDYYRDRADRDAQRHAFRAQVAIARDVGKALVIHMRSGEGPEDDAAAETLEILANEADGVEVILHCYSAGPERVRAAAERGWYCSFAGNVTYPKAEALREAARLVPEDLVLVETDAPYLAPQSRRGRPNESALVVETAREVAAARGVEYEAFERLVEANAERVLGW